MALQHSMNLCRFEDLLRSLSMERADIRTGMVFALDNADSAGEVRSAHHMPGALLLLSNHEHTTPVFISYMLPSFL